MEDWLSLKVSEKSGKSSLLVSVPKKKVRLAVHRNRLKRLIREVFRAERGKETGRVYAFRVCRQPEDMKMKLPEVEKLVIKLLEQA